MIHDLISRLSLDRPLIVFDTETTGLSVTADRIVELAYLKYSSGNAEPTTGVVRFNPGRPIPASATAVHGISDADVAEAPVFADKAVELLEIFRDSFYSGFNIANYDMPLLQQEFGRAGHRFDYRNEDIIDAQIIYHAMEPRTLSKAYEYYCNKSHDGAHNALADVEAAAEILAAQVERYGAEKVQSIHEERYGDRIDRDGKFYWKDGEACFSFSKFKHQPLGKVLETEPSFLQWMLGADFSEEVKAIIQNALKGNLPKRD